MPDDPSNRLFGEKEISRILKRAAEIQEVRGASPYGLSLAELREVAAGAGIDPASVEAAVAELAYEQEDDERASFWGGPMAFEVERVVEGEATEETWEALIAEARRAFNLVGTTGQVGRSLEWTAKEDVSGNLVQLTVTPRGGRTKIRLYQKVAEMALGIHAGWIALAVLFVIAFTVGARFAPLLKVAVDLLVFVLLFLLARSLYGSWTKKRRRQAEALTTRLAALVPAGPPAEALPAAAAATAHAPSGPVAPRLETPAPAADEAVSPVRVRDRA
jgi:hypothetical protein